MTDIFPTLKPGKYAQASTVAPSADKLKMDETAGDKWKRVSSWIHPHSHGCTREHFKKGEEEIRIAPPVVYPKRWRKNSGCCLSKWKIKNGLRKNIDRNNKSRKVVNEIVGIGELKVSMWFTAFMQVEHHSNIWQVTGIQPTQIISMTGSGLKSAQRKWLGYIVLQTQCHSS
jgi:hypothetical protein